jgi:hypothetical protein
MTIIIRPETGFDGASHKYTLEGWADDDVVGISSAAKIGQALEAFDIGSRWGFRLGYEGAHEVIWGGDSVFVPEHPGELREAISEAGLAPWSKRDAAADRGTWVHDVLEALGQDNRVPQLSEFSAEVAGHVKSMLGWYVYYRPSFIALEVQVASKTYGLAGRYDVRCYIDARKLVPLFLGHETAMAARIMELAAAKKPARCLVDLKTSKDIYPTTHFPQLALYELASVEIGFPPTDCQLVLNTKEDGSAAKVGASWVEPGEVLSFIESYRAIKRITAADPAEKLKRWQEEAVLAILGDHGPLWARQLAGFDIPGDQLDGKAVGRICGRMRKRGLVEQDERKRWLLVSTG